MKKNEFDFFIEIQPQTLVNEVYVILFTRYLADIKI